LPTGVSEWRRNSLDLDGQKPSGGQNPTPRGTWSERTL